MPAPFGKNETCSLCNRPALVLNSIKRATKYYHRECFTCQMCKCRLEESPTLKEDQQGCFYCASCYMVLPNKQKTPRRSTSDLALAQNLIWGAVPKCVVCSKVVYSHEQRCWGGKVYHRGDCFRCSECAKVLEDTSVCEQGREQPCCRSCWNKGRRTATAAFNPVRCVCAACNLECNRLKSNVTEVGQKVYHSACLRCVQCDKQLSPVHMLMNGANCYCQPCYNKQFTHNALAQESKSSATCVECGKDASAQETVSLLGKVYHASCLKCGVCFKKVDNQTCVTDRDMTYCKGCHSRLFKPVRTKSTYSFGNSVEKCGACGKACYATERVLYNEAGYFHPSCIRCSSCNLLCNANTVGIFQSKFYCLNKCYKLCKGNVGGTSIVDSEVPKSPATQQSCASEESSRANSVQGTWRSVTPSECSSRIKVTDVPLDSVKGAYEMVLQRQQETPSPLAAAGNTKKQQQAQVPKSPATQQSSASEDSSRASSVQGTWRSATPSECDSRIKPADVTWDEVKIACTIVLQRMQEETQPPQQQQQKEQQPKQQLEQQQPRHQIQQQHKQACIDSIRTVFKKQYLLDSSLEKKQEPNKISDKQPSGNFDEAPPQRTGNVEKALPQKPGNVGKALPQSFGNLEKTLLQRIGNVEKTLLQKPGNVEKALPPSFGNAEKGLPQSFGNVEKALLQRIGNVEKTLLQKPGNVEKALPQSFGNVEKGLPQSFGNVEKALLQSSSNDEKAQELSSEVYLKRLNVKLVRQS